MNNWKDLFFKENIYYKTKNGILYNGNSLEILKHFPDNSIDTVITDPPYGLSDHSEKVIREVISKWLSGEDDYVPKKKGFMGKCYDKETEVLTIEGWKKIKDIVENKIQTKVYTLNPDTRKIELCDIKQYHKYYYEGELYHFTGRSVDLKVTPNHHLVVETYPLQKIKFIEAQKTPKSFIMLNTGNWEGIKTDTIEINGVKYPIKEFMFFFGVFLEDGFVVNRKKHKHKQDFMGIAVYKKTIKKRKPIEEIVKKLKLKYNFTSDTQILIYDKNLVEYFKQFGKAQDKYIPKEFFKYDKEILIELYRGLMITDGHVGKKGKVLQYSSASRQLIDDIQHLVFLIGRSSTFNKIKKGGESEILGKKVKSQDQYRLTILKENKKLWFEKIDHKSKKERFKKIYYNGYVYDIGVEKNHILYIRRNGKTVWSSNSWDAFVPPPALWKEVYRIMKPGGTILVFAGSRTQDLMALSLRLAGFEIKDTLMWLYGCVSEDTEILTINGFKKYFELQEGEEIYTFNLQTGEIEKDKVLEKFVYDIEDDIFVINDYMKISKNHKVILKMFDDSNKYGFRFSDELYEDFLEQNLFIKRGSIPLYNIKTNLISYERINKIKKIKYKGKVWSIKTNNMSYIARRNGKIFITGNSGFPKAYNIAKGIDVKLRVGKCTPKDINKSELIKDTGQEVIKIQPNNDILEEKRMVLKKENAELVTAEAKKWEGIKSHGLKPAYEPILCAIKPNDGSYVDNALKWNVSGLNIDEARISLPTNDKLQKEVTHDGHKLDKKGNWGFKAINRPAGVGRFPSNIILDEEVAGKLDEQAPQQGVFAEVKAGHSGKSKSMYGDYKQRRDNGNTFYKDGLQGASRFFYIAKANKKERQIGNILSTHPTMKPLMLIDYLIKLTKMPNEKQIILDPFMGSGTTGIACEINNRNWIGIELNEEYCNIAKHRILAKEEYKKLLEKIKKDKKKKGAKLLFDDEKEIKQKKLF